MQYIFSILICSLILIECNSSTNNTIDKDINFEENVANDTNENQDKNSTDENVVKGQILSTPLLNYILK
ncbi:hypothetical protein [Clostridium gasigenes]|uniref:hypothetical protein n=1 Tax=Clostridium gasigenes TaxID=94869 RepID=UPI001A9B40FD|nr:hypothetical protein [Clostridium gasigenes]